MSATRPYYHEFAWAYDLLQTDPVAPRVDFVQEVLHSQGIATNARILDTGCGTGRYTVELAKRGYQVCGVDCSPELIAVAQGRALHGTSCAEFIIGDLLAVPLSGSFDVILCRGVLNDFVEESDRSAIFHRFATWLRPAGLLIFDVREWARTVTRYQKNSFHQHTVDLPDGTLRFQSETALDRESRRMLVRESFDVCRNDVQTTRENGFVMGCWTSEEITERLLAAGFERCGTYLSYGESEGAWSDRLVTFARKRREAPNPT
jgi:2-polyprenyl-3-methyl-5-hydroxy-6-metoxy-1,4-benzoquinol methylase